VVGAPWPPLVWRSSSGFKDRVARLSCVVAPPALLWARLCHKQWKRDARRVVLRGRRNHVCAPAWFRSVSPVTVACCHAEASHRLDVAQRSLRRASARRTRGLWGQCVGHVCRCCAGFVITVSTLLACFPPASMLSCPAAWCVRCGRARARTSRASGDVRCRLPVAVSQKRICGLKAAACAVLVWAETLAVVRPALRLGVLDGAPHSTGARGMRAACACTRWLAHRLRGRITPTHSLP
jgi:hypothetical protein